MQLGEDYDLVMRVTRDAEGRILSGVAVGDTLAQNQALIIGCHRGEFKEQPAVGAGISDMLLDHDPLAWRTVIREQLEMDGQAVDEVAVTCTGIRVKAGYPQEGGRLK